MRLTDESATSATAADPGFEELVPLLRELAGLRCDHPRRAELRERLVAGYLPLARNIARRFSHRGEAQDDLEQVATVGLINAVDRFEPARGSDFLAFAIPTITGEIRRHFRDHAWAMRVPRRLKDLHITIGSAMSELSQRHGRAPTVSELAEHLELSREEVLEGLQAAGAYRSSSLDSLLDADRKGAVLKDVLGRADAELDRVEFRTTLAPLLGKLPERERTLLKLRFFANLTQSQIAERVGMSQMHVSRLLSQTLARLRRELGEP